MEAVEVRGEFIFFLPVDDDEGTKNESPSGTSSSPVLNLLLHMHLSPRHRHHRNAKYNLTHEGKQPPSVHPFPISPFLFLSTRCPRWFGGGGGGTAPGIVGGGGGGSSFINTAVAMDLVVLQGIGLTPGRC